MNANSMNATRFTEHLRPAATVDHLTGRRSHGAPAEAYRRVGRTVPSARYGVRRAAVLGGIAVVLFAVAQLLGAVNGVFGSSPALAEGGVGSGSSRAVVSSSTTHVARDGDSLWSIAELHRGEIDRNSYIDALVDLNSGTAIHVGQAVLLP